MKTSTNGVAFVDREEGEVLHLYTDSAGKPTIGVGHLVKAGENFTNGITHDEALALLAGDLSIAEGNVNRLCPAAGAGTLSQNAFDALISFTFNCGGGALQVSSVRRLLNAGDMAGAAAAFELWDKRQDPKTGALVVDAGLLARRKREAALFLTPDAA
jgi:lysozyme